MVMGAPRHSVAAGREAVLCVGPFSPGSVGIMADSHGDTEAVVAALAFFGRQGCRHVLHLGDICDSESPPAAVDDVVRPLIAASVLGVMGNNENALLRRPESSVGIDPAVLAYLSRLPLQIASDGLLFVHNRPFPDRLGTSCLWGDIGADDRRRMERRVQGTVLFRGHSHRPSVWRSGRPPTEGGRLEDKTLPLARKHNWIATCGAVQSGWCMIWHPADRLLTLRRL